MYIYIYIYIYIYYIYIYIIYIYIYIVVRRPIRQEGNPFDRYILNVSQDVASWRGM